MAPVRYAVTLAAVLIALVSAKQADEPTKAEIAAAMPHYESVAGLLQNSATSKSDPTPAEIEAARLASDHGLIQKSAARTPARTTNGTANAEQITAATNFNQHDATIDTGLIETATIKATVLDALRNDHAPTDEEIAAAAPHAFKALLESRAQKSRNDAHLFGGSLVRKGNPFEAAIEGIAQGANGLADAGEWLGEQVYDGLSEGVKGFVNGLDRTLKPAAEFLGSEVGDIVVDIVEDTLNVVSQVYDLAVACIGKPHQCVVDMGKCAIKNPVSCGKDLLKQLAYCFSKKFAKAAKAAAGYAQLNDWVDVEGSLSQVRFPGSILATIDAGDLMDQLGIDWKKELTGAGGKGGGCVSGLRDRFLNTVRTPTLSQGDCLEAAQKKYGEDVRAMPGRYVGEGGNSGLVVGSWPYAPHGCSVGGGDMTAHFNKNANGINDGTYHRVY